jgi:hypothetical protein
LVSIPEGFPPEPLEDPQIFGWIDRFNGRSRNYKLERV